MREDILKSIKEREDRLFVASLFDKVEQANKSYTIKTTAFIDPHQQGLIMTYKKNLEADILFDGGFDESERKVAFIIPRYEWIEHEAQPIVLMRIASTNKFGKALTHRDYLGALMNLSIDRSLIGDIVVHKDFAFVFCLATMKDFIHYELSKVRRDSVCIEIVELDSFYPPENFMTPIEKTVSSLRLDAIISSLTNLSRSEASKLILSGKVKLNHVVIESQSKEVLVGDLISIPRFGRFRLSEIRGCTKKERLRLGFVKYL